MTAEGQATINWSCKNLHMGLAPSDSADSADSVFIVAEVTVH